MIKKLLSISMLIAGMFSQSIASDCMLIATENGNKPAIYDSGDSVIFENPCYVEGVTEKYVTITNGSVITFAGKTTSGKGISALSMFSKGANPRHISHASIVIILNPKTLYEEVTDLVEKGLLSEERGGGIIGELELFFHDIISAVPTPDVYAPFIFESSTPRVKIAPLQRCFSRNGELFLRTLTTPVSHDKAIEFFRNFIYRDYEKSDTFIELALAVGGLNSHENPEKVFCSEFVTLFYQYTGVIDSHIQANNTMPHMFSIGAGKYDLLKGKASDDVPLKIIDPEPSCCCGPKRWCSCCD